VTSEGNFGTVIGGRGGGKKYIGGKKNIYLIGIYSFRVGIAPPKKRKRVFSLLKKESILDPRENIGQSPRLIREEAFLATDILKDPRKQGE